MNTVATEMIKYYAGDKKRINHFIKVHGYAKAIGEAEVFSAESESVAAWIMRFQPLPSS